MTNDEKIEQEPCDDCISRQAVLCEIDKQFDLAKPFKQLIKSMPPVTPKPKTGHWIRMSNLSEQEDDRYQCSRCKNIVHHKDKINLYTFNSWCGRCGSNNGRN